MHTVSEARMTIVGDFRAIRASCDAISRHMLGEIAAIPRHAEDAEKARYAVMHEWYDDVVRECLRANEVTPARD